jgi:hypothetical protein
MLRVRAHMLRFRSEPSVNWFAKWPPEFAGVACRKRSDVTAGKGAPGGAEHTTITRLALKERVDR